MAIPWSAPVYQRQQTSPADSTQSTHNKNNNLAPIDRLNHDSRIRLLALYEAWQILNEIQQELNQERDSADIVTVTSEQINHSHQDVNETIEESNLNNQLPDLVPQQVPSNHQTVSSQPIQPNLPTHGDKTTPDTQSTTHEPQVSFLPDLIPSHPPCDSPPRPPPKPTQRRPRRNSFRLSTLQDSVTATSRGRQRSASVGSWASVGRDLNNIATGWDRRSSLPNLHHMEDREGGRRRVRAVTWDADNDVVDTVGRQIFKADKVKSFVKVIAAVGIYLTVRKIEMIMK